MSARVRSSIILPAMKVRLKPNPTRHPFPCRNRKGLMRTDVLALLCCVPLAAMLLGACDGSSKARTAENRAKCLDNLKEIAAALTGYHQANDQRWPYIEMLRTAPVNSPPWSSMADALKPHLADPARSLHCPADIRVLEDGSPLLSKYSRKTTWFDTEGTSYEWMFGAAYGGRRVGEEEFGRLMRLGRADQFLLRDFDTFHTGDDAGTFNTLNADLKPRTSRDERSRRK